MWGWGLGFKVQGLTRGPGLGLRASGSKPQTLNRVGLRVSGAKGERAYLVSAESENDLKP